MRDLRKQALLESGKTVSRKARSKQATPSSSRATSATPSRAGSRVHSANASDDEGEFSDGTQWSTNSIDDLLASPDAVEAGPDAWAADLADRIAEICERKRSSAQGREDALAAFCTRLTRHYARDEIHARVGELLPALLRGVRAGATEKETGLALKALALLLLTEPSDAIYDAVAGPIKANIMDSPHASAKVAAIHALAVATFYGGATVEETEEVMEFFLGIASSDGATVNQEDDADVVTAAMEEWGFLATQLDDIEEVSEEAMETFAEQLESSSVDVQIAAGENIALLFEKSYTEAESDEEAEEDEEDHEGGHPSHAHAGPRMIKRYTVYRQTHQLTQTLAGLAKASSKRLSKKDRKSLHLAFADVLHTVEHPTRGPRYSTALDDDGREYGSRLRIGVHGGGKMTIDAWWKLHRWQALKRLLQGGFLEHYEHNQVVFDSLPVILERA